MAQTESVTAPVQRKLDAPVPRGQTAARPPAAVVQRRIRALELWRPASAPPSLVTQVRATAATAWRWLAHSFRVAMTRTGDLQGSLHADPKALHALIRKTPVAMVTTRDRRGALHSEPMEATDREFDGEIWFATRESAAVLDRIRLRAAVQVTYIDRASNRCVVLDGIGRICAGADRDSARTYVRVDIMSADVWE